MSQLATQQPQQSALFAPKPSALAVMAARFSCEPSKLLDTLKSTVFKGASNDELLALVVVANEYGLNPLTKEIYAFPAKGGGIVPVVSVDGWNNLANSHKQMDGMEFEFEHSANGGLISCTCVIYRKDRNRPIKVTEYLAECRRNTDPWKMEHRMLRHKALIQCARVAFGFSGVYEEEEARTIAGRVVDVVSATVPDVALPAPTPPPKAQAKPSAVAGTAEPLVLDASPAILCEVIAQRLAASGYSWEDVATEANAGGLFVDPSIPLAGQPDDVLHDILGSFTPILEQLQKMGGAQ